MYRGHARAAVGPVSTANRFWLNSALQPPLGLGVRGDGAIGARRLSAALGATLLDRDGNRVEFSLVTNAGNKLHERTLALIQQDLARFGIQLNVVTLDFPSLVERISRTFNYEAVLMAMTNVDLDPSAQMRLGQLGGESPMESEPEDARHTVGSRDR